VGVSVSYILAVVVSFCDCSQADSLLHTWHANITVVDENSQPVPGAEVSVTYDMPRKPDGSLAGVTITGLTDTNGLFRASHRDGTLDLLFRVQKSGYYQTTMGYEIALLGQPINPTKLKVTEGLVLKKIGQPIPMYAKQEETKIQKENEPVGFDLMAGDWIAPYGKGKTADMLFTVYRKIANEREYDAQLKVTFPNPGDGIAVAPPSPDTGSEFKTSRTAVENGYVGERILHYSNSTGPEPVFGYFIRVQTVLDQNGKVKSALYGKINGDFRFYAGTKVPRAGMGFNYYLNPTPNDRNVEFDPRKDLFKKLNFLEEVTTP
jgi:hypothetical protein